MKILWFLPPEFELVSGGAWTQINSMFQEFQDDPEIQVDFFQPGVKIEDYDLVHLFRADMSLWSLAQFLISRDIPYWVTPIFYAKHSAKDIKRILKASSLAQKASQGIRSNYNYTKDILNGAQYILPNTQDEIHLLADAFDQAASKFIYLKNGIRECFFQDASYEIFSHLAIDHYDLCTGVFGSPRKNTLPLLKAYIELEKDLVLIGDFNNNAYSEECLHLINSSPHLTHFEGMDPTSSLYRSAVAHADQMVMPSLYETPGLSALEAAAAGTPIVITAQGGTKDYFKEHATYFDDLSPKGIYRVIQKLPVGPHIPRNQVLKESMKQYQWNHVAQELKLEYQNHATEFSRVDSF